jgi:predicted transposase/invertase (TIGR01784 family)
MNEETHEILSDKVQLVTLELGKFNKKEEVLETDLDYWMYCFKHSSILKKQPKKIQGEIFNRLFSRIDTENLTDDNMEMYNKSIMEYADVRFNANSNLEIGYEKGIKKVALNMLNLSMPINEIAKATGLTPAQIQQIKK